MRLPPYAEALGLRLASDDGAPLLALPFREEVLGRPGFLHGGAIAGMLEMAAFAALQAEFEDSARPRLKPVNITVDFMRGGRERETFAQGMVLRLGACIANVEAEAWQEARAKPIARARMTVLIVR